MRFRVASYNIRKAVGTDRRRDPNRIIDILNEMDPDIVALQEADRRFGKRTAVLSDRLLRAHSDLVPVPLDVQADSMGWHGNVLLVRSSLSVIDHDILHIPCLEPRGAIWARIRFAGGGSLHVLGMHLDLSGLWRRRQAAAILNHVAMLTDTAPAPVVMMGDLNEWRVSGGCIRDFGRSFSFAPCGKSFHARQPIGALDRIMHHPSLRLLQCGVHTSALSRCGSDHLPIWADFDLG